MAESAPAVQRRCVEIARTFFETSLEKLRQLLASCYSAVFNTVSYYQALLPQTSCRQQMVQRSRQLQNAVAATMRALASLSLAQILRQLSDLLRRIMNPVTTLMRPADGCAAGLPPYISTLTNRLRMDGKSKVAAEQSVLGSDTSAPSHQDADVELGQPGLEASAGLVQISKVFNAAASSVAPPKKVLLGDCTNTMGAQ